MPLIICNDTCPTDGIEVMTLRNNYEIQGKFKFYETDDQLRKEWKPNARSNIKYATFLEGVLLKSLDTNSKSLFYSSFLPHYQTTF